MYSQLAPLDLLSPSELTQLRDAYLDLLGLSATKPIWVGLQHYGRDIVTRKVCPVIEVTPAVVKWAEPVFDLRNLSKQGRFKRGSYPFVVVVSGTPAGRAHVLTDFLCQFPCGDVHVHDVRVGARG
jgi:hypothetical protein